MLREVSKNIEKANEIVYNFNGLKNIFSLLASLIALVCLFFVDYQLTTKYYIAIYCWMLMINGINSSINAVFQAYEKVKYIAARDIVRTLLTVPASIIAVYLGKGVLVLILIQMAGSLLMLFINYYTLKKMMPYSFFTKININKIYIKSGFIFSMNEMLNVFSSRIDLFMLSLFTSPYNVGIYAFAYRLVEKFLLFRNAISQGFFPYYAKELRQGSLTISRLHKHTLLLLAGSFVAVSALIISSGFIIPAMAGDKYKESILIFNILLPYVIFQFVSLPHGLYLQIANKENVLFYLGLVRATCNIVLNIILYKYFQLAGIAYSSLITFFIWTILIIIFSVKYQKSQTQNILPVNA